MASRTERIREVCEKFGLQFEVKIAEDDTMLLILRGPIGLSGSQEAEKALRQIVEEDWLITFDAQD